MSDDIEFNYKFDKYLKNNNIDNIDKNENDVLNEKSNKEKKSNIKIINNENKNDNFICDLDI